MRKILKLIGLALILSLPFIGCSNGDGGNENPTIQDKINEVNAGGTVDLKNEKVTESVTIGKAITLKNADFDGKVITVKASGTVIENVNNANIIVASEVGDGDFTIKSSKGITLDIQGGGAKSIHIENVEITYLEVAKVSVRVELKGDTKVQTVAINVSTAKIESVSSDSKTPQITLLKIGLAAENIEISGGVITTVEVKFADDETSKSVLTISGGAKITTINAVNEAGNKKEDATIGVTTTGDVTLPEDAPVEVKPSTGGENKPVNNESVTQLLDEAIDLLLNKKFDEGIDKIKAAYDSEKNDTTKMYYALAQIALISTNENTVKLMKENLGFEDYPNKLNALISGDWFPKNISEKDYISKIVAANPEGFNPILKTVIKAIDSGYESTKTIAASMSESSVALPTKAIKAFELEEFLGDDEIYVGKAELNVLIAALGLVKGTLQYLSAFDLSSLRSIFEYYASGSFNDDNTNNLIKTIKAGTMPLVTIDDATLVSSKATFVEAIDLLISSYEYISGDSSTYPEAAKDALKEDDAVYIYNAAKALRNAINDGKEFYVVNGDYFRRNNTTNWPTSEATVKTAGDALICTIDMGKAFTPKVWDNLLEKDANGKVQFYMQFIFRYSHTETKDSYQVEHRGYEYNEETEEDEDKYDFVTYRTTITRTESESTEIVKLTGTIEDAKKSAIENAIKGTDITMDDINMSEITKIPYVKFDASNVVTINNGNTSGYCPLIFGVSSYMGGWESGPRKEIERRPATDEEIQKYREGYYNNYDYYY